MKEGVPDEIDGVDVTNVPLENQEEFVKDVVAKEQFDVTSDDAKEKGEGAGTIIKRSLQVAAAGGLVTVAGNPMGLAAMAVGALGVRSGMRTGIEADAELKQAEMSSQAEAEKSRELVDQNPDIELARAEMERGLLKKKEAEDAEEARSIKNKLMNFFNNKTENKGV